MESILIEGAEGRNLYYANNCLKVSDGINAPVIVYGELSLIELADYARNFMVVGFTRFRLVMDDYVFAAVLDGSPIPGIRVIGLDTFTGNVDMTTVPNVDWFRVNVIACVVLAIAADDHPEAENLYPLANRIVGDWISKPIP